MNKNIASVKTVRRHFLQTIEGLTIDQLNVIPENLNNNIAWHLGHLVVSMQGLTYVRSGLEPTVDRKLLQSYRPDTKPEAYISGSEVEELKQLLLTSVDRFETDYNNNLFASYTAWTSRYGVEITSIDEALQFILYHEGMHMGYVMVQKRLVLSRQGAGVVTP